MLKAQPTGFLPVLRGTSSQVSSVSHKSVIWGTEVRTTVNVHVRQDAWNALQHCRSVKSGCGPAVCTTGWALLWSGGWANTEDCVSRGKASTDRHCKSPRGVKRIQPVNPLPHREQVNRSALTRCERRNKPEVPETFTAECAHETSLLFLLTNRVWKGPQHHRGCHHKPQRGRGWHCLEIAAGRTRVGCDCKFAVIGCFRLGPVRLALEVVHIHAHSRSPWHNNRRENRELAVVCGSTDDLCSDTGWRRRAHRPASASCSPVATISKQARVGGRESPLHSTSETLHSQGHSWYSV